MNKELNPSLRTLALQVALQLPDDQKEAISVLRYGREIVERRPEKTWPRRGGPPRENFAERLAAERRRGSSSKYDYASALAAMVAHDKAGVLLFDGPRRREAARGGHQSESMSRIICRVPYS
jgi:hypothetical protein